METTQEYAGTSPAAVRPTAASLERMAADYALSRDTRLRERLIELALRDAGPWRQGERRELYEFFRRSGLSERARRAVEGSRAAGGPERSRRSAGRKPRKEGEDQ